IVTTPPTETFADFGLQPAIVEALTEQGFETPFPIQAMTLPIALERQDIIGQAKTGTGKTLGFGLPALEHVIGPNDKGFNDLPAPGAPQALIVTPTRELAVQVCKDLEAAAAKLSARIGSIYGGRAYEPQIRDLKKGVEIVVGTPGRLIDLMKQRHLNLQQIKTVVLDEQTKCWISDFCPMWKPCYKHYPNNVRLCCSQQPCPEQSSTWRAGIWFTQRTSAPPTRKMTLSLNATFVSWSTGHTTWIKMNC